MLFLSTSGHELGFLGFRRFGARHPRLIRSASAWIHLGSSIGATQRPSLLCAASDRGLQEQAVRVFAASGARQPRLLPPGGRVFGEVEEVQRGGGRFVSLMGGSALFHFDSDRWPDAVSVDETARYAQAFGQLGATLAE